MGVMAFVRGGDGIRAWEWWHSCVGVMAGERGVGMVTGNNDFNSNVT